MTLKLRLSPSPAPLQRYLQVSSVLSVPIIPLIILGLVVDAPPCQEDVSVRHFHTEPLESKSPGHYHQLWVPWFLLVQEALIIIYLLPCHGL